MIQTTTWSPDTCPCTLHYSWDDSVPADQRVHTPVESVTTHDGTVLLTKRCQYHVTSNIVEGLHGLVIGENQRKNNVHADLLASFKSALGTTGPNGNIVFKDNVISWSFDGNRDVVISVKGLTTNQLNNAQSAANAKYGAGKITVQAMT